MEDEIMKKRTMRLLALGLAAGILAGQGSLTAFAETCYIKCDDYVNMRSERSYDDSTIIDYLWNGSAVELLDVDDIGWCKIYADGMTGYVASYFISYSNSSGGSSYSSSSYDYSSSSYDSGSSYTSYGTATIYADVLNLRSSGSYSGAVIGAVTQGQTVEIIGYSGDWVKVVTWDGCVGYLNCIYLGTSGSSGGTSYSGSSSSYSDTSYSGNSGSSYSGSDPSALYQVYLEKQAAADQACYGTDQQAVYDTAAAAQRAYKDYVNAVNARDAANYSGSSSASYTSDSSSYEETYTEPEETYTEPTTSSIGQQMADFACQYVGCPYVWGGSSLSGGADCSGFVMAVMANFGVSLPHNAAAQSGYGTPVSLDSLQPGDLLFYNGSSGIGHVTMYIGNGQVVHASNPTNGIIISNISYRTPCCARRYV